MSRMIEIAAAAALALASLLPPAATMALAADYTYGDEHPIAECEDQRFLNRIVDRFSYQVKHVPHLPDVQITDFRRIHEHRYQPQSEEWPIGRRYCGATVVLSDGRKRDLWYVIEGRMGFAGIGENVQFCVSGFDRWYVYNGRCRVLR